MRKNTYKTGFSIPANGGNLSTSAQQHSSYSVLFKRSSSIYFLHCKGIRYPESSDIQYLRDIEPLYANCKLIGDKAYLDAEYQLELFQTRGIQLETPMRTNQKDYQKQPFIFRRVRKRIETIFSQFVDQFLIRRNYAKTFLGLSTRILAKITTFTLLQFINHLNNKPLNHVKHALA